MDSLAILGSLCRFFYYLAKNRIELFVSKYSEINLPFKSNVANNQHKMPKFSHNHLHLIGGWMGPNRTFSISGGRRVAKLAEKIAQVCERLAR